jgi:hypothetical protein
VKALLSILVVMFFLSSGVAQEIYKWEDEKGVIHYGEKPASPKATPFEKEKVPYSNIREGQEESPVELENPSGGESDTPRVSRRAEKPAARPSPSMKGTKAWIDRRGDFWLSGVIRNGGKGICEAPGAEVAVIDELGSVDGRFEISAKPTNLGRGEEAEFSGSHFAPIGDKFTWEATPRCNGSTGVIDGARKRGKLTISRHRTLRMRR